MKARGFTLIEMVVGMAVALIVIGVVTATFLSQQKALQTLDLSRDASNASRDAMLSLQETISRAGYGIDPRFAFDFRSYNCTGYGATTPCRDRINAPDEIVFVERDPNYYWASSTTVQGCDPTAPCQGHAWNVTSFNTGANQVTINARAGDTFLVGQVVQIACQRGLNRTMGTVSAQAIASAAGNMTLTLTNVAANNPYKQNIPASHDACFDPSSGPTGVSLFLVNRYRFHIATVGTDPWLMLDRGLDYNKNGTTPENGADTADEIPIAHGVEGIQISYLLAPPPNPWTAGGVAPTAPDNGADWIIGDTAGTLEEPSVDPLALNGTTGNSTTGPTGFSGDTDLTRFNTNAANIRGVRIRLTVRSILKDLTITTGDPATPPILPSGFATSVENRNDFTAVTIGQFRRYFTSVVTATPNLRSRDPFIF